MIQFFFGILIATWNIVALLAIASNALKYTSLSDDMLLALIASAVGQTILLGISSIPLKSE